MNIERARYGLKPLAHNWELSRVARFKSSDMRIEDTSTNHQPTGAPLI